MPLPLKEYDWKRINTLVTGLCWDKIGFNGHALLREGKVEVIIECSNEEPCEIVELEQLVKTARERIHAMEAGPFQTSHPEGTHTQRTFMVYLSPTPEPACLPSIHT